MDNTLTVFGYGEDNSNKLALILPAYGSSGEKCMQYLYTALSNKGFFLASFDYPGQNSSNGEKLPVRGHDESVKFLHKLLTSEPFLERFSAIALFGYDYGAALAMNYSMLKIADRRVKQIFSFHPAWSQDLSLLHTARLPIVLLWVPAE